MITQVKLNFPRDFFLADDKWNILSRVDSVNKSQVIWQRVLGIKYDVTADVLSIS